MNGEPSKTPMIDINEDHGSIRCEPLSCSTLVCMYICNYIYRSVLVYTCFYHFWFLFCLNGVKFKGYHIPVLREIKTADQLRAKEDLNQVHSFSPCRSLLFLCMSVLKKTFFFGGGGREEPWEVYLTERKKKRQYCGTLLLWRRSAIVVMEGNRSNEIIVIEESMTRLLSLSENVFYRLNKDVNLRTESVFCVSFRRVTLNILLPSRLPKIGTQGKPTLLFILISMFPQNVIFALIPASTELTLPSTVQHVQ